MNCPSCGRGLATGAKCIFCGPGTVKRQSQLNIPKGTVPERRRGGGFPWGKILLLLLLAGAVAACFLHPELNAKIKSFLPQ